LLCWMALMHACAVALWSREPVGDVLFPRSDLALTYWWSVVRQYLSNRIKCIDKLTGGPFLE